MSVTRAPLVGNAEWCPAYRGDSGTTTCVAIREHGTAAASAATDGGTIEVAVCQVCGVETPLQ